MNIILLSGGSGKRLWPLSNDVRSKQFIKVFKYGDQYESMVQRMYRQIKQADPEANITIATSKSQVSAIHNQIGYGVGISVEPDRRDTFPAIALATAYLHDIKGVGSDEAVVVCPVDPYVEDSYFECLKGLYETARRNENNLTLMGIEPTYPSEKYGYIIPESDDGEHLYFSFKEKPDKHTAIEYIKQGALWNGGVFAYKLSYVLNKANELLGICGYDELLTSYSTLKKISFDYAVVEHETSIDVLRYRGQWRDLGTWNTLTTAMSENISGNAGMSENCENVHILNELDIPIFAMGVKNLVIAAGPDGILVSDKDESSYIKPYVDRIDQQVMFAEKSWGSYHVLDVGEKSLIIKISIKPGDRMNYHSHERRDEVWTVVKGQGRAIVDDMEQVIKAGDVITMASGCKHMVVADTELEMVEIQLGEDISVKDKHKYDIGL